MATHSRVLAWRIPGTGEPGGLPSMGSHRVGHGCSDLAAAAATSKIQKITSAGENVEKFKFLWAVGGNVKWYSCYGKQHESESVSCSAVSNSLGPHGL